MTFIQLTIILRLVVEQIKSFNLLSTHLGLTQILCLIVFKVIFTEEYDIPHSISSSLQMSFQGPMVVGLQTCPDFRDLGPGLWAILQG